MYSILNKIEKYAANYGVPFKSIYVSSSYFPEYFNRIVLRELNKKTGYGELRKNISEYIIDFSNDGKIRLMTYAYNGLTRVVIFPTGESIDYKVMGMKLSESDILEEVENLEKEAMSEIINIIRVKGLTGRINISSNSLDSELDRCANMCINYIDYYNKYYQNMLKDEICEEKSMIKFCQPVTSTIIRSIRVVNGVSCTERVNSILPVDERKQILESYDYLYSGYAYSKCNRDIEYLNYLYDLGDNKYALVMEPYSGNSATKIRIINEEEMSREMFENLTRDSLNLSFEELCRRKDIVRLYHSTMDNFDNKLSLVLKGVVKSNNTSNDRLILEKVKKGMSL